MESKLIPGNKRIGLCKKIKCQMLSTLVPIFRGDDILLQPQKNEEKAFFLLFFFFLPFGVFYYRMPFLNTIE